MTETHLPEEVASGAIEHMNRDHQNNLLATAHVTTPKASRYLKALCNHFDRKVNAQYGDTSGKVQFPFGECILQVVDNALLIQVAAANEAMFARVKHVVADHLVRFAVKEELTVNWVDAESQPAS